MTDCLYETSHDFKFIHQRAVVTEKGTILLLVTVYPSAPQKPASWIVHRFTPEMVRELRKIAKDDPSAKVRLRAAVVLDYVACGLSVKEAARRLGWSRAAWYPFIGSLVRHGVARDVLEKPFRKCLKAAAALKSSTGRTQ